ncbi:MAG: hemolysin III family protein [Bacteroidales bacterium]|jgi:hemolysin III|nr:hemolysin III family protein [Bacteroidales bacterium]
MTKNRFTKGEEIANSISHGLGIAFAIVALVLMLVSATRYGTGWHIVSYAVYGSFLILLYISSTLNHSLISGSKSKNFFHNFDQIAIFLFIAATYTPLSLIVIRNDWGWVMFGIAWGFALTGVIVKIIIPNKFEKGVNIFYVIAYLAMGFIFVLFLMPLYKHMDSMGVGFIIIGAACYGLGVLFFKMEKIKYSHLIWHLLVIAGSVFHWIAIYGYTLQLQ